MSDLDELIRRLSTDPDAVDKLINAINERMGQQLAPDSLGRSSKEIQQRWLLGGEEIILDTEGAERDILGHSYFDVIDAETGFDAEVNSDDPRRLQLRARGGGADCMFDHLVSSCWATEISEGRGTQGQLETSRSGCTFRIWSTIQACWDGTASITGVKDETTEQTVFICPGGGIGQLAITGDGGTAGAGVRFVGSNRWDSYIPGTAIARALDISGGAKPLTFIHAGLTQPISSNHLSYRKTAGTQNITLDSCRVGHAGGGLPVISGGSGKFDCFNTDFAVTGALSCIDTTDYDHYTRYFNCTFGSRVSVGKETWFEGCTHDLGGVAVGILAAQRSSATELHVHGSKFRSSGTAFTHYVSIERGSPGSITFDIQGCTANTGATSAVRLSSAWTSSGGHNTISGNSWGCDLGLDNQSTTLAIVNYSNNRHNGTTGAGAATSTPTIAQGIFDNSTFDANEPARSKVTFSAGSGINKFNGVQVAGGAPTHNAQDGQQYWDITNDTLYVNTDGSTTWAVLSPTFSGDGGFPHKIIDADGDTYVSTEESADSDVIEMASAGTIRGRLSALGLQLANDADLISYSDAFSSAVATIRGSDGHAALAAATVSDATILGLSDTFTDPSTGVNALAGSVILAMTANNAQDARGLNYTVLVSGEFTHSGLIIGAGLTTQLQTGVTAGEARGLDLLAVVGSAATLTDRRALYVRNGSGMGAITNQYGLYIEDLTKGGTLNIPILSLGGNSRHVGSLKLGANSAPSEVLDVTGNIAVTGTVDGVDVAGHSHDGTAGDGAVVNVNNRTVTLNIGIGDGSGVIATGIVAAADVRIDFDCTVKAWRLTSDQSGSMVIDVWADSFANFPPTVADTIAGSEKPTLSTAQTAEDADLTTWTTAIAAGTHLRFNVDSAATVTFATLSLELLKDS